MNEGRPGGRSRVGSVWSVSPLRHSAQTTRHSILRHCSGGSSPRGRGTLKSAPVKKLAQLAEQKVAHPDDE